jgi:mannose-1-phosphate guanylyltransferase
MSRLPLDMTEAFVLGAGLGMRLRPLTDDLPKPLVPIFQKPLITFAFDHLIDAGIDRLVVNTHRLPEKFRETFTESIYRDRKVVFLHEPKLLGTGGGLKNALPLLRAESFIVYSGDILTDFALAPLLEEHQRACHDVTLALRETPFKPSITLRGNRVVNIGETGDYDFANVSIWRRETAKLISSDKPVSFIPKLVEAISSGGKIGGVVVKNGKWFNIGSSKEYLEVHRTIAGENWKPAYLDKSGGWPISVAASANVDATASLCGFYAVGANCRVGPGARLTDTILWPGARIAAKSQLRNCIVRSGKVGQGTLQNVIV